MPDPVGEQDLHAYVDGALDPARAAAVESHLATNRIDAGRVEAYRAQRALLRVMYQHAAYEPEPPRLGMLARQLELRLSRRRPARRGPWLVLGLLLALLIGFLLMLFRDELAWVPVTSAMFGAPAAHGFVDAAEIIKLLTLI